MNRKLLALVAAFVLLALAVTPGAASVRPPGADAGAASAQLAGAPTGPAAVPAAAAGIPASETDETKVPHYFGPYSNWANSPQVLADAIVDIGLGTPTPVSYGNPLIGRAYATDYATAPGTLGPVFVVLANAPLPAGTLQDFQVWNQTVPGGGPNLSAGNLFHAYVLHPTGTTNQYNVVFDSGLLTMPVPTNPGGEVATFSVAPTPVLAGDLIGFYGEGIPVDTGVAVNPDTFSYLATTNPDLVTPAAPIAPSTLTLGGDPGFPIYATQDRAYSFAATVTPTVADPGTGAQATATVDPKTGAISAITVTSPGAGYVLAPKVTITSPGVTPTSLASATATISTGVVTSIAVNEFGFGFTKPSVTFTGGNPTPGFDATAVASGGVDNVTIVNGGGKYTTQAIVTFDLPDQPGGVRATGTATFDANGVIDTVTVVDPGSGYSFAPGLTITDAGQTPPAVLANVTSTINIGQIAITSGGQGYDSAPTVTISDSVVPFDKGASATARVAVKGAVTAINVTAAGAGYLTPGLKKFVDKLPGLGPTGANDLGNYIPVAVPDTTTYPGSDYYEIAVVQYRQKFHKDLPATLLRGYVQLSTSVVPGAQVALSNANLDPSVAATPIAGFTGVDKPSYLGPTIIASKDRPVRILFRNLLPTGVDGNLFLPVDTTLMGSGMGPTGVVLDANNVPQDSAVNFGTVMDGVRNPECGLAKMDCFAEDRATLHLHGGITPWISDGTPHQWTTPAGEVTDYPQGVSVSNVPDMPDPGPGAMTFFYTNQQSARLMFYHDHAWGITRLNVYAGEAAGYVLTDATETALTGAGGALETVGLGTPLVIQDKTFVSKDILKTDPTWDKSRWGGEGSLWAPHVYMPAQNPGDPSGMSSFGRWMYGPWFWPPAKDAKYPPIKNPYFDPNCNLDVPATWQYPSDPFCEPALIPGTPNISVGMEAFNDTPIVNGTAYPTTNVDPKAYRYRILNAANDRFWNLSWYVADPTTGTLSEVALKPAEVAAAQTDVNVFPTPDLAKSPAGPNWVQIGTEGGFLPTPVVVPAQPITWITDPTRFDVGNVDQHSLLLAPAERADVIVDFSAYRGKTLILYNDAPAAFPARVGCYDYYTGGPDLTPACAPSTLPGYGPNTRTIMQVKVSTAAPAVAWDRPNTTADRMGALMAAFGHKTDGSGVFESGSDPIIVGQAAYNAAYGTSFVSGGWCSSPSNPSAKCDGYARIAEGSQPTDKFKFDTLSGPQLSIKFEPKGMHDEMNSASFDEFGRMTANLGLEAPGATPLTQNIILYPFVNPATEILDSSGLPSSLHVTPISSAADGTQIWKITHNGVDTHPIHFHLYDVQVINRVTWDNIIIPPDATELGWKDTVRISPLEDTIVAVRPIVPTLPFGVPDSRRPLNPMMPVGAKGSLAGGPGGLAGQEAGFNNTDTLGNPIAPISNDVTDFNWEYVFHCHILSHEEMDMMRPVIVKVTSTAPDAPVLTLAKGSIILNWTDGTPVNYLDPTTWANPKNEIGYRIERATGTGAFVQIGTALANVTTFTDLTTAPGTAYSYRVIAFNEGNASTSNVALVTPPNAPSGLTALAVSTTGINLTWNDNSLDETGFVVERCSPAGCTNFAAVGAPLGPNSTATMSFSDTGLTPNTSYSYRVYATGVLADSLPSNVATATTWDVPPAAPSGLTAKATGQTTIDLVWTNNATNQTGYRVERCSGAGCTTFVALSPTLPGTALTFTDTGLTPNTSYSYQVVAFHATGASGPSNIASATTYDVLPADPTGLSAAATGPTTINLAWTDNATNETGYRVERCSGIGCSVFTALVPTLAADSTTFTDTLLTPSTSYSYRVVAFHATGNSGPSNVATAVTLSGLPAAPTGLVATAINALRIDLSWTDNAGNETGYRVERCAGAGCTTFVALVPTLAANSTSFSDSPLVPATTYSYRVIAFNGTGDSAPSNVATATTPDTIPNVPTNLAAVAFSPTRADLTWTDTANNETGFTIQRSTSPTFTPATTITLNTANLTAYSNTGRTAGATYYYRIRAFNAVGFSGWSNVATVTMVGIVPAAPSNPVATAFSPTQVNLTWTDNATNENGFTIQRSTTATFTTVTTITLNTPNATTYSNTGRTPNTTYYYRIRSFNGFGTSAWVVFAPVTTLPVIGAVPTGVTVTPPAAPAGRTSLDISWTYTSNGAAGPVTFQLQRSNTGAAGWTTVANGISATTFNNGGLPVNTTRYYRVRSVTPGGNSAWSVVASGTTLP